MSGLSILLNDSRGVYVPRDFANNFDVMFWGFAEDDADIAILKDGPENELYWEAWDSILTRAECTDADGNVWRLYQDGDLFTYCHKLLTSDEWSVVYGEDAHDLESMEDDEFDYDEEDDDREQE